jgi:FO synthase
MPPRPSARHWHPRLTVYPEYVWRPGGRWLHPDVRFAVQCASDSEGLARDDDWSAGGHVAPPLLVPATLPAGWPARARTAVGEVLDGVLAGEEVDVEEIVTLLGARGCRRSSRVSDVADEPPRSRSGRRRPSRSSATATSTTRRSCTFKCRFCAFSKGPLSLNLRGDPYLLRLARAAARVVDAGSSTAAT